MFWESVYPSVSKFVHWFKAQQTARGTTRPDRSSYRTMNCFCFSAVLQLDFMKKHRQPSLRNRNRKVHHLNMDYLPLPGSGLTTTVDESRCRPQCQTSSGCTEICCETPSCISLQSESLSNQKSHTTFKGLIGSAPCGVVTFISRLY